MMAMMIVMMMIDDDYDDDDGSNEALCLQSNMTLRDQFGLRSTNIQGIPN